MEEKVNSQAQKSKIAKKLFSKALRKPRFYDGLLKNPQEALQSAGFSLTPEELDKLIQHLNKAWEITELNVLHLVREIILNLINPFADREVSPKPPPPPPPPGWWPEEIVLKASIRYAKSQILKAMETKSSLKSKTKSASKRKRERH
jgi:hypothetical protein